MAGNIALDSEGKIDDVAIACDGFRLERMADNHWWICLSDGEKQLTFHLVSDEKGRIAATLQQDGPMGDIEVNITGSSVDRSEGA